MCVSYKIEATFLKRPVHSTNELIKSKSFTNTELYYDSDLRLSATQTDSNSTVQIMSSTQKTLVPDVFSVGQRVKTQFGNGVVAEKRDNDYVVIPHTSTWVLAYGQKPILNLAPNMLKPDDA